MNRRTLALALALVCLALTPAQAQNSAASRLAMRRAQTQARLSGTPAPSRTVQAFAAPGVSGARLFAVSGGVYQVPATGFGAYAVPGAPSVGRARFGSNTATVPVGPRNALEASQLRYQQPLQGVTRIGATTRVDPSRARFDAARTSFKQRYGFDN